MQMFQAVFSFFQLSFVLASDIQHSGWAVIYSTKCFPPKWRPQYCWPHPLCCTLHPGDYSVTAVCTSDPFTSFAEWLNPPPLWQPTASPLHKDLRSCGLKNKWSQFCGHATAFLTRYWNQSELSLDTKKSDPSKWAGIAFCLLGAWLQVLGCKGGLRQERGVCSRRDGCPSSWGFCFRPSQV